MDRSVTGAWALDPIGVMRLGDRDYPIPPLTFGRFQSLLTLDGPALVKGLLEEQKAPRSVAVRVMNVALRWAVLKYPRAKRPLWWIVKTFNVGKGSRHARQAAPIVAVAVPGVTEEAWRNGGSLAELLRVFLLFARAHDWAFIAESIRFGETPDDSETLPSAADVTAGLMAIAKESGYTIEGLAAMRVEGFYRLVDGIRAQVAAQPQPVHGDVEPVEFSKDNLPPGFARVDISSMLADLTREDDEVPDGSE